MNTDANRKSGAMRRIYRVGDWNVDTDSGQISREGTSVKLEPKVMDVLVYLASRKDELVTREDLERDVWRGALVGYDAMTSTIIKLRKALGDDARNPQYIATVPKRGYRLIVATDDPAVEFDKANNNAISGTVSLRNMPHAPVSILLVSTFVLVLVLGIILIYSQREEERSASVPSAISPSIVVLPFDNLSGDPSHEYFADGMTDDIITDLSRLSKLRVFSGNISFSYKDREVQPQKIGSELGVDFVLDGSVRRSGDTIRVNAQLVDTKTGLQKWASRYDRRLIEVFAIQDEVTANIVKELSIQLTKQEKQRLEHQGPYNLKAYELFQEGQRLSRISSKETNEQAQAAYRQAIRLDPYYARAYGALAYNLAFSYRLGWTDSPVETLDRALELAKQAVSLDNTIPHTHWALGYVYLRHKDFTNAKKAVEQAISVSPNYADGYGLLALISNSLGEAERAIDFANKGMQLNPYYTWDYPYNLGRAYYTLGRYDEAIESLSNALERNENAVPIRLFLAASYVQANRLDDAEWEIEQIMVLTPSATIAHLKNTLTLQNDALMESFLTDLREAGMPE